PHRRRDDREQPRRRTAGARGRQAAGLWPGDHRRLHRLGHDRRGAGEAGRRGLRPAGTHAAGGLVIAVRGRRIAGRERFVGGFVLGLPLAPGRIAHAFRAGRPDLHVCVFRPRLLFVLERRRCGGRLRLVGRYRLVGGHGHLHCTTWEPMPLRSVPLDPPSPFLFPRAMDLPAPLRQLPNQLTVARIAAVPVVCLFIGIGVGWLRWLALVIYVVAALTDWLDGYLARRMSLQSDLGKMLDPIADKLLVGALIVTLAWTRDFSGLDLVPAIAILFREIFISGLREFMGKRDISVPVTFLAKWKTTVQLVA